MVGKASNAFSSRATPRTRRACGCTDPAIFSWGDEVDYRVLMAPSGRPGPSGPHGTVEEDSALVKSVPAEGAFG